MTLPRARLLRRVALAALVALVMVAGLLVMSACTLLLGANNPIEVFPEASPADAGASEVASPADGGDTGILPFDSGTGPGGTSIPQIAPTSHDFGSVSVGATSSVFTFTVTNLDTTPASIQISLGPPDQFALAAGHPACPASLDPKATCNVDVVFAPRRAGSSSGSVTVTRLDGGPPVGATVSGTGVAVAGTVTRILQTSAPFVWGVTDSMFVLANDSASAFVVSLGASPSRVELAQTAGAGGILGFTNGPWAFFWMNVDNNGIAPLASWTQSQGPKLMAPSTAAGVAIGDPASTYVAFVDGAHAADAGVGDVGDLVRVTSSASTVIAPNILANTGDACSAMLRSTSGPVYASTCSPGGPYATIVDRLDPVPPSVVAADVATSWDVSQNGDTVLVIEPPGGNAALYRGGAQIASFDTGVTAAVFALGTSQLYVAQGALKLTTAGQNTITLVPSGVRGVWPAAFQNGQFAYFSKTAPDANGGADVWRVPFGGGQPEQLDGASSVPIGVAGPFVGWLHARSTLVRDFYYATTMPMVPPIYVGPVTLALPGPGSTFVYVTNYATGSGLGDLWMVDASTAAKISLASTVTPLFALTPSLDRVAFGKQDGVYTYQLK